MLRDPKDVAVVWSGKTFYGSVEDTRNQMANLIRARDRAVIAEAKRVVQELLAQVTEADEGDWWEGYAAALKDAIDELDDILKET